MHSPQDHLINDHSDLTYRYENKNSNELNRNAITNIRLLSVQSNNVLEQSINSSGGSDADDDDIDMYEDNCTLSDTDGSSINNCVPIKEKVKLNFSVDSILSGEIERTAAKNRVINMNSLSIQRKLPQIDENKDNGFGMDASVVKPMPMRFQQTTIGASVPGKYKLLL